jgi:hypothetical protein
MGRVPPAVGCRIALPIFNFSTLPPRPGLSRTVADVNVNFDSHTTTSECGMACDTDRLIRLGSRTLNTKTGTVSYPNRATVRDCIKRRSGRGLLHRISSAAKDAREARDCTTQERAGLEFEVRLISRFSRRLSGREGCSSGSCRKPDSLGLAMVPWAGNGCPEHSLARESGIRLPAP